MYDKNAARCVAFAARKNVADKPGLSRTICSRAAELLHGNVLIYISIGDEVITDSLIDILSERKDVTLYAPYTSSYGVIEVRRLVNTQCADRLGNLPPECYGEKCGASTKLDCCVTPLVGFNARGYRIGYGKGCYDRFFAKENVYKIGLAYSCQAVEFAPDITDVPLDCCVTEKKVIYF